MHQLRRISDAARSPVRIVGVEEPHGTQGALRIPVTIDCRHYTCVDGGLPLHNREGLIIEVPAAFPFRVPSITSAHLRFLGFPHVQWGRKLCLYVSVETQWIPSKGMFGFMAQLDEWLRRAARNELDALEGPLHPPVAYQVALTSICVSGNTPGREEWPWFGGAVLRRKKPGLLEVEAWSEVRSVQPDQQFAPTVLLDFELPFEYPRTVDFLLRCLERNGVPAARVLAHLMMASERVSEGERLYVGIGTPARGAAADVTNRLQHITFWEVKWRDVQTLCAASFACEISARYEGQETSEELQQLIASQLDRLKRWRREARVRWCHTIENRSEIVTRRDEGTAMDWFRGKRVALWGCGALGGLMAEHLARAGVSKLVLHDRGLVTPGILVRQNFGSADIGELKALALRERIKAIAPHVTVAAKFDDLINTLDGDDWDTGLDVVIDATASLSVRSKLEATLKGRDRRIPITSVMISGDAQRALAVLTPPEYSSGPLDTLRRLGLAAMGRDWLSTWVQAFWTSDASELLRQPEPGCSDPTFVASHADVANLAARAVNSLAKEIDRGGESATGLLLAQSLKSREHCLKFAPDIRWDADGIEFRLSESAWRDMQGWIRAGARERSAEDETGGLLFGEFDETMGIAWISNVSGPPGDSVFSPERFVCGTEGTRELCDRYQVRTHGVTSYVGTWHSHPVSPARPSPTDYAGIGTIFAATRGEGAHQLMLIVGNASSPRPHIGGYAFEKQQLVEGSDEIRLTPHVRGGVTPAPPVRRLGKAIGLSLSGGGSRAVAFHLGTLRALEDLDLLDEIEVVSGVSGGSVMTGLIGYTDVCFREVDAMTVQFLRNGLVKRALGKLMHPRRLIGVLWNFVVVALPQMLMELLVFLAGRFVAMLPRGWAVNLAMQRFRWPFRRRYSRTHVMAQAVEDLVGSQRCDGATRQGKSIVFNACELRTGAAFRMSNERYGCWRYGWAPASELRVADAITASAAYPAMLPPFDWKRVFELHGQEKEHRVVVTDGGVFDNLGVSVMEPGRDIGISAVSYDADIIIASDAGMGQITGDGVPTSWWNRMIQVSAAVMRKVQDATKKRLHDHAAAGRIDGFVYVGLGQKDARVHPKSGNWVRRDQVMDYPTDFNAMAEEDIDNLAGRGEAITRSLITRYLLSD